MGLLRLLLAIAVVIYHSGPLWGIQSVGGVVAVESFFMISGFYMALVLNGKYAPGSYRLFITNRLLRLYPAYWVMVGLTILVSLVCYLRLGIPLKLEPYQQAAGHLSLGGWVWLSLTNLFIIGQDVQMFMVIDQNGNWHFSRDYLHSHPFVHQLMFVHQAWSMAIEILFYLVAPWLLRRRTGVLVLVGIASLGTRLLLYRQGLFQDPWNYRFFPSELVFFVVGALAYRASLLLTPGQLTRRLFYASFGLLLCFTVLYQFVAGGPLRPVAYYLCLAGALPFVFLHTRNSRWQQKAGELSYPIYISHILVLLVTPIFMVKLPFLRPYQTLWVIGVSVAMSLVLIRYVIAPVERLRQRRLLA
jgi:peptidoglycan/LPS O-acetylase OafA/YrhL